MQTKDFLEAALEAVAQKKQEALQALSEHAVTEIKKVSQGKLQPNIIDGADKVTVVVPFSMFDPDGKHARSVEENTHAFQTVYTQLQDKSIAASILIRLEENNHANL